MRCDRACWRRRSGACSWRARACMAHHEILAKFDDNKPVTLNGVVTLVDWRNPHVHVFMNVADAAGTDQLGDRARRARSICEHSGWSRETLQPGRSDPRRRHRGPERQPPGVGQFSRGAGDRQERLQRHARRRPRRRSNRGRRRGGPTSSRASARRRAARQGTGRIPSVTALAEGNSAGKIAVPMDTWGLLKNIADAPKVAPMQPWALQLYTERQRRFLQDDPMYLNCKPPGGPRQFQLAYGVQFVEDRERSGFSC